MISTPADRLQREPNKKQARLNCIAHLSIPLDLPIDELVTWKQLIGDRRLSDALAECDARGWDALPLATKEMSRLFPNLWATKKAAERWIVTFTKSPDPRSSILAA